MAPAGDGWQAEFAGDSPAEDWALLAQELLQTADAAGTKMLAYHDAHAGQHRFACFQGGKLLGALFIAGEPVTVSRAWAGRQLAADFTDPIARLRLLAGRAAGIEMDPGAIVCACFEVGRNQIIEAATTGGCATVEAIGNALNAGSNCGSCRMEIETILGETRVQQAS